MSKQDELTVATDRQCDCKIGRNTEKYDLDRLDERLLTEREEGASLRALERVVNTAILRTTLRTADREIVGDVSSFYGKLTDDDASAGERTEVREWLSLAGIDPEELTGDFVSYQTVRTHLRECLDVETNRRQSLSVSDAEGTIEWARSRSEGIVERTFERLNRSGEFDADAISVDHVIRVTCTNCERSYPVDTFLDRGGCHCESTDTSSG